MRSAARVLAAVVLAGSAAVAPAGADKAEWAGLSCGMTFSNDPTGMITNDPNVYTGLVDCGPWTAFDVVADDMSGPSAAPGPHRIRITATVQPERSTYAGQAGAQAVVEGSGDGVAEAVGFVAFVADGSRGAVVYLCTHVEMTDSTGTTYTWTHDADDYAVNGIQCSRVHPVFG